MKIPSGLSRMEQETFFRTDAASNEWQFYSRDPKFKRRLEKKGYAITEDHQGLWSAKIPLRHLTVRNAVQKKRKVGGFLSKSHVLDRAPGTLEAKNDHQDGSAPVEAK